MYRSPFTVTAGEGKLSGQFTVEHVTTDANGRAQRTLTLGPGPGAYTFVGVSVLGSELLVTFNAVGTGTPNVLFLQDGHTEYTLEGHTEGGISRVTSVAFSPYGDDPCIRIIGWHGQAVGHDDEHKHHDS